MTSCLPKWYNSAMSVKEIEDAIAQLPAKEVTELMSWLAEHHAQLWDKQIEDDLDAGCLDALLAEVDKEYEVGLARPLRGINVTEPRQRAVNTRNYRMASPMCYEVGL